MTKLYEDTLADLLEVEDDLFTKNSELLETISSLQKVLKPQFEIVSVKCEKDENSDLSFTFHTKDGKKNYSNTVHQLYYMLLADQVPPAKVSSIIKSSQPLTLSCLVKDVLGTCGGRS